MARQNIKQKAQNLYADVKNSAKSFMQPKIVSPVPTYTKYIGPDWQTKMGNAKVVGLEPFARAQRYIESSKPVSLPMLKAPRTAYPGLNTTMKVATGVANVAPMFINSTIGKGFVDPIVDVTRLATRTAQKKGITPYAQLKSPIARAGYNISGYNRSAQQMIGNVAGSIEPVFNAYGGGKVFGLGGKLAQQTAKAGLKQIARQGITQGAKYGLGGGILSGLSEGRDETSVWKQLLLGGKTGLQGAVVGGALGGAVSGAGYGIGVARGKLTDFIATKNQLDQTKAQKLVDDFLRDEKGRFAKGFKQNKQEPAYYGDMREALGLPRSGDYLQYASENNPIGLQAKPIGGTQALLDTQTKIGSSDSEKYLKELVSKQKLAKQADNLGIVGKLKSKMAGIKASLVDEQSPIEDALSEAEKKYNFKVMPKYDIRANGIDRVLRSRTLAGQFATDNGLVDVIQTAPDLDALNQYLIAKQATDVAGKGIKTGRDMARDQILIQDLAPQYEQHAQQVNEYSKKLLQYSVDSGLVSQDLAEQLVKEYPHYVPLQRVFNELEKGQLPRGVGTKQVASLGSQSIVQKLKGSEREIANPIESLLIKTQDAFAQGERNKTAKMLASYKDLPGFETLIREAPEGAKHTFSFLDNGVKRVFETTPEIEAAAKSLNQEQMGTLIKIINLPTRGLQLGATGLNLPFTVTNIAKDEMTGFVNSNKAASTSILNPVNFVKSVFSAVKHDDLYDEVVRNAGAGTSFDISRQAPELTVEAIRAGRSKGSKVLYTATSLERMLRAVENIVGRGEEVGRIKNYAGTKEALLAEGRTMEDATILASQAARENTANFARKGSFGRTLNYVIPFFNAGIQGSRQLVRSFQNRPAQTGAKVAVGLFMPVAAATAWNLSDPIRKKAYDDISQTEKENNILIVPPNPTKDKQGRWNVIKLPIAPGLSNLTAFVRRPMEQASGLDPVKFSEMATNLIAAGTSVDLSSPTRTVTNFIPQGVKLAAEPILNKNFYTGKDIVPKYQLNKPVAEQVAPWTSGTARKIGGLVGVSPLKVENVAKTGLGGLGSQILNASDKVLYKTGKIPAEQIGGESAMANLKRRFTQSYGGEIEKRDSIKVEDYNSARKQAIEAFLSGDKNTAKKLKEQYNLKVTTREVKQVVSDQKTKALDLYLDGDKEKAVELRSKYKLVITKKELSNRAKTKAVNLFRKYRATGNDQYLNEAKALRDKYGFEVKNSDI